MFNNKGMNEVRYLLRPRMLTRESKPNNSNLCSLSEPFVLSFKRSEFVFVFSWEEDPGGTEDISRTAGS
jgi:hypothetical protein